MREREAEGGRESEVERERVDVCVEIGVGRSLPTLPAPSSSSALCPCCSPSSCPLCFPRILIRYSLPLTHHHHQQQQRTCVRDSHTHAHTWQTSAHDTDRAASRSDSNRPTLRDPLHTHTPRSNLRETGLGSSVWSKGQACERESKGGGAARRQGVVAVREWRTGGAQRGQP